MSASAQTPPPASASPAAESTPHWHPPRNGVFKTVLIVLVALAALLCVLGAWRMWPFGGGSEVTDNAYVHGRTTIIAPHVGGYVVAVDVTDYARVEAGQILARIADRIYAARVEQARANVSAQLAALANSTQAHASRSAGVLGQAAALVSARAQTLRAKADLARVEDLAQDGSVSVRERDQTIAAMAQAEALVRQAEAAAEVSRQELRTVDVGRAGLEAQVDAARAQLTLAEIDLDHTTIRAPQAGQVGEVGVRLGQYATPGTQFVALVPDDRWVIANFKEAQTAQMRAGQKATLTIDALADARLSGTVELLAPAAGSEFAVLKPDNATGNFVKVPQRIGVRIGIDPGQDAEHRLRPGMSVEAVVDVARHEPGTRQ